MGKTIAQKNTERLVLQQKTELQRIRSELSVESLRAAEDKLLAQCMEQVEGLLDFSLLGFDDKGNWDGETPPEWDVLTIEQKTRKIRLAKYGCMTSTDIPHAAKMAHATMIGIIKARAQEKGGTKILNLEVSTFPAPKPLKQTPEIADAEYEVIDLE